MLSKGPIGINFCTRVSRSSFSTDTSNSTKLLATRATLTDALTLDARSRAL